MPEERFVEIPAPTGRLAGVLHLPEGRPLGAWLMPPAGMRDRSGPARLYVRLARALAADGHVVLRYDGRGLGESAGDPPSSARFRAYEAVQEGLLSAEVLAASAFLRAREGRPQLVLGLCGGVLHAAHLARLEPGAVGGVFGVGAPVLRIATEAGPAAARRRDTSPAESPSARRRSAGRYLRRATDPAAWRRLFGGETDYGALLRSFGAVVPRRSDLLALAERARRSLPSPGRGPRVARSGGALEKVEKVDRARLASAALASLSKVDPRVERRSWEALVRLAGRGAPVALAWGELDGSLCAFEDYLRPAAPELDALIERHVIPSGTHECAGGRPFERLQELARAFAARAP